MWLHTTGCCVRQARSAGDSVQPLACLIYLPWQRTECNFLWGGGLGNGAVRGPGDARNIKAPWKLSGTWVLPALRANSPVLAHPVVYPDIVYDYTLCSRRLLMRECARMCVRRIKIPLHLEVQTPWVGALRAAIKQAAVWGGGHSLSLLPPYFCNTDTLLLPSPSLPSPLTVDSACCLSILLLLSVQMRGQSRLGGFDQDCLVVCICESSVQEPLK